MDRIGPYVIGDELGGGAMGTVFRARHQELGADYALKLLKPTLFQLVDELRFQREMQAMAAVSDVPGVVAIHSAGVDAGQPYYVMDLVSGEDLSSILRREGRLELRRALRYGVALAETLAELHARGLIHRDLKPANVLIDEHDRPRLADFGLSKAFADEAQRLTATGEAIGTPLYMAPEQARGEATGPPVDVYALGMLLFVTAAGVPAVTGQTSVEILIAANSGSHDRLRAVMPLAPLGLDELCADCFRADPAQRPTALEVAARLRTLLEACPEPEEAGVAPPPAPARPRALASGLGFAGLLLIGVAGALVVAGGWGRAEPVDIAPRLDAYLQSSLRQLAGAAPVDTALAAQLPSWRAEAEAWFAERPSPSRAAQQVRLELLAAELALRAGDAAEARAALEAARAIPSSGPPVRAAKQEAVVVEALLEVAAGDAEGRGLALVERALQSWEERGLPPRRDLQLAQARCLLAKGRGADAHRAIVAAGAERFPAELRCAAALEAGKLEVAGALLPRVTDPTLRARVCREQALAALVDDDTRTALEAAERGALARFPALAQPVRRALGTVGARVCAWTQGPTKQRLAGMGREVAYHRLRRELEPGYAVPEPRVTLLIRHLFDGLALGTLEERLRFLEGFIRLCPDQLNSYEMFGQALGRQMKRFLRDRPERVQVLVQGRARTLAEIERARAAQDLQGVEQATNTRANLTRWLAQAYNHLDREADLRGLLREVRGTKPEAAVALTLGARLLRTAKGGAEARRLLARARGLAPGDLTVCYAHLYALQLQGEERRALEVGRGMLRLWTSGGRQDWANTHFWMAMSWLSLAEERAGNLGAAARAALEVCGRMGWSIGWAIRYAQLRLRVRPPIDAQQVVGAARGVLNAFSHRNHRRKGLTIPPGLLDLARRGKREELRLTLGALARQHPAKAYLLHPADF